MFMFVELVYVNINTENQQMSENFLFINVS
jgi:hypothetical protein